MAGVLEQVFEIDHYKRVYLRLGNFKTHFKY